jgi:hypothetical protein
VKKTVIWTALGCCLVALTANAQSPIKPKAGLYDVATQMNMGMAGAPTMPPRTSQVCVTQAMIDKYGGPYSNPQSGCQTTNVSVTPTGMTADVSCTGRMTMNGKVQATFVDASTVKTTIQMSATLPNGQSMNMTMNVTSTYKGADCGSVQPPPMPGTPPSQ